jgi:hypothetical protein
MAVTKPASTALERQHKRSVERWGEDEQLGLPTGIEINGRHYRKLSEIEAWERSRAVTAAAKTAERKRNSDRTSEEKVSNRSLA